MSDEHDDLKEVEKPAFNGRSAASILIKRTSTVLTGLTSDNDRVNARIAELEALLGYTSKKDSSLSPLATPPDFYESSDENDDEDAYQYIPINQIIEIHDKNIVKSG